MAELPDPCRPQAAMLRAFCPLSRQYGVFSFVKPNSEGGACIPPVWLPWENTYTRSSMALCPDGVIK